MAANHQWDYSHPITSKYSHYPQGPLPGVAASSTQFWVLSHATLCCLMVTVQSVYHPLLDTDSEPCHPLLPDGDNTVYITLHCTQTLSLATLCCLMVTVQSVYHPLWYTDSEPCHPLLPYGDSTVYITLYGTQTLSLATLCCLMVTTVYITLYGTQTLSLATLCCLMVTTQCISPFMVHRL